MIDSDEQLYKNATTQALNWLILLQEDPDDESLRAQFNEWLNTSDLHQQAWQEAQNLSALTSQGQVYRQASRLELEKDLPRASLYNNQNRLVWGAFTTAIAACFIWLIVPIVMLHIKADHLTGAGEIKTVTLSDGSTVALAAQSAVQVSFEKKVRKITLLSGQAFFEVTPNRSRPFIVSSGKTTTRVLGTAFEVSLKSTGSTVLVKHGTVHVTSSSADAQILQKGDGAKVQRSGGIAKINIQPSQVAVWRRGRYEVNNRPVSEVLDELRRYYSGIVILTDKGLGRRRITGVYDLKDPKEALRAVALAHGAKLNQVTPWVIVISSR